MGQIPYVSTSEINSFVERNLRPTIIDQRFQSKALLGIIRGKKRLIIEDGGSITAQPILAQPNQTAVTYIGADTLPTDSQEEFTNYQIPWKQSTAAVTIVSLDKLRASGKRAVLNLIKDKTESAYMSLFDKMGSQLYGNGTGNGGKDWDGIGGAIQNASGFQVYLGIDRVANPWWQAQVINPGVATALSSASMMTLWMACKTDEERIHVIVTTKTGYASYWSLLTPQEQFYDPEIASLGFLNIAFQGNALVDDSGCPAGNMYFINLDHLRMFVHEKENFKFSGFDSPINQNVETGHIYLTGNYELRKPSSCGLYTSISNA